MSTISTLDVGCSYLCLLPPAFGLLFANGHEL